MEIAQVQRAALDSAGQLMAELAERAGIDHLSYHINRADLLADRPFIMTGRVNGRIIASGSSATLPEAFDRLIADRDKPPLLATPRQVVDAVRDLLDPQDPLRAKIDALPIA